MPLFTSTRSQKSHADFRSLFSDSATPFFFVLLGYSVKYAYTILITRKLGSYAMGVFSLSFTVVQVSSVIARLGVDSSLLRFISGFRSRKEDGRIKQLYLAGTFLVLSFGLLLSGLVYALSPWMATAVFKNPQMERAFHLASLGIVPLSLLYVEIESLRGLGFIKLYAFFLHSSIFLCSCLMLLAFLLFSLESYIPVAAFVAAVWLTLLLAKALFLVLFPFMSTTCQAAMPFMELIKNSLPLMLATSILLVMGWTDIIMLGMMTSANEVGVYHVVVKVASCAIIPAFAINAVATRKYAEYYESGDIPGLLNFISQASRLFFYVSFPLVLILGVFAPFVLSLFGRDFQLGSAALRILLVGQFMPAFSGSIGNILKMTNNQVPLQYCMVSALGINIILNALLIPRFGINGAAVASALSATFWNVAGGVFFYRRYGVNSFYLPGLSRKASS